MGGLTPRFGTDICCKKTHTATHETRSSCARVRKRAQQLPPRSVLAMEKAQKAVDSVVDGVKKVAIGKEKKSKAKKEKGGDGGADGSEGRLLQKQQCTMLTTLELWK